MPSFTAATIRAATLRAHTLVKNLDEEALADLQRLYRAAAEEIARRMAAAAGSDNTLTYRELDGLRRQIESVLASLAAQRNELLDRNLNAAARLGAAPFDLLAVTQGVAQPVSPAAMRIATNSVAYVRTFMAADGLQLSDRLWRVDRAARDQVINGIERAVVEGQGAAEAARDLIRNGLPISPAMQQKMQAAMSGPLEKQVLKIMSGEGGVVTQAMRVMRTEVNRAHGEAYMASAKEHPEFAGFRFLLSPAHPETDICDLLAEQNLYGLGPGVYPTRDACPWPAHPNTLSFVEVVFADEVSDKDRAGKETQREALERMTDEQRQGILGVGRADLFNQGKFRKDWVDIS